MDDNDFISLKRKDVKRKVVKSKLFVHVLRVEGVERNVFILKL